MLYRGNQTEKKTGARACCVLKRKACAVAVMFAMLLLCIAGCGKKEEAERCSVADCKEEVYRKGLCEEHYAEQKQQDGEQNAVSGETEATKAPEDGETEGTKVPEAGTPTEEAKPTAVPTPTPEPTPTPIVEDPNSAYLMCGETEDGTGIRIIGYMSGMPSNLVIPEKIHGKQVTEIGKEAFSKCNSLTSVTIPDSVISVGEGAFRGTPWEENQLEEKGYAVGNHVLLAVKLSGDVKRFLFPDGIKVIADRAFAESSLSEVVIPDGVTHIGKEAFYDCLDLTSMTFPDSLRCVGDRAFMGTKLTGMKLPDGVEYIGESAFAARNVSYAYGYRYMGNTELIIPGSVKTIGRSAFKGVKGKHKGVNGVQFTTPLTRLVLQEGVEQIGEEAFAENNNLTEVTFPNSLISIGDKAFSECGLTEIMLPDGVTSIGELAFSECKLKSVTIPGSMKSIGELAFFYNYYLEQLTLEDGIESIGSRAFQWCSGLSSVTIPASVKEIGGGAFAVCNLTSVVISEGVISIGESAFSSCKLTSVVIPEGVTSIGAEAFSCDSLTEATIPASVTSIGDYAFGKNCGRIIAPSGSYAERWAYERGIDVVNP